jgi:hypothetical protein
MGHDEEQAAWVDGDGYQRPVAELVLDHKCVAEANPPAVLGWALRRVTGQFVHASNTSSTR